MMRKYEFDLPVKDFYDFRIGDKLKFKSWKRLRRRAMDFAANGFDVAVIGVSDMTDNILTITDLPQERRR